VKNFEKKITRPQSVKIQENIEEDSDDPEPADEGYIQMKYTSN
jgi:hypothetical protein